MILYKFGSEARLCEIKISKLYNQLGQGNVYFELVTDDEIMAKQAAARLKVLDKLTEDERAYYNDDVSMGSNLRSSCPPCV